MKTIVAAKNKLYIFSLIFFAISGLTSVGGYWWLEHEGNQDILVAWLWYWGWVSLSSILLAAYFIKISSYALGVEEEDLVFLKNGNEVERNKINSLLVSGNFILTSNHLIQYRFGEEYNLFAGKDVQNIFAAINNYSQKVNNSIIYKELINRKHLFVILFTVWIAIGVACYVKVSFFD